MRLWSAFPSELPDEHAARRQRLEAIVRQQLELNREDLLREARKQAEIHSKGLMEEARMAVQDEVLRLTEEFGQRQAAELAARRQQILKETLAVSALEKSSPLLFGLSDEAASRKLEEHRRMLKELETNQKQELAKLQQEHRRAIQLAETERIARAEQLAEEGRRAAEERAMQGARIEEERLRADLQETFRVANGHASDGELQREMARMNALSSQAAAATGRKLAQWQRELQASYSNRAAIQRRMQATWESTF